jgi:hypothetical protein
MTKYGRAFTDAVIDAAGEAARSAFREKIREAHPSVSDGPIVYLPWKKLSRADRAAWRLAAMHAFAVLDGQRTADLAGLNLSARSHDGRKI